ncbi:MAG TPA: hypothetical protein VNU21_06355 [Usitatibacter sp.]|nr:hypothetical protein [Usitatibacter sp.]
MNAMNMNSDALELADPPTHELVGIKVRFLLNTRDGLRRVVFGLEKTTDGDDVKWVINFELYERDKKTDGFGDAMVTLDVEVDTRLNNKAETVARQGLTPKQAAHALGPAADDARDEEEDDAKLTVQDTLRK